MPGRIGRMVVGGMVITVDLAVFVSEHVFHVSTDTGWQVAKTHLPFLILGYLLIDWSHAFELIVALKDKIPSFGKKD